VRGVPTRTVAAVAALVAAVAAASLLLFGGDDKYVVKAQFVDAGQVVKGGLVLLAGQPVGKIGEIRLTDDNLAEIRLDITDDNAKPIRRGTVATIRTVGLSGVTNRYVSLEPGPEEGEEVPDGGVLELEETRPIVDLDTLLNTLDEPTRNKLKQLIKDGDAIYDGTAPDANRALRYLNPAIGQTRALAEELATDTAAVGRLVTTGAVVAKTLASRRDDVASGISTTATTLRALADERTSLQSALQRAPGTLTRARGTLRLARGTLREVRPAIRDLRPVAGPAADLLRTLPPASRQARPVLEDLNTLLPAVKTAVDALPALRDAALPALRSTTSALTAAQPVFTGLRPYAPDVVVGLFQGLGGRAAAGYDANGHYARIAFAGAGNITTGLLSALPQVSIQGGYRTGRTARCPGGAAEPAQDGSNPFRPDPTLCNPDHDRTAGGG
jgi:phospholipid/cholesterol/gamma-HCH transport system substrate-binding protein